MAFLKGYIPWNKDKKLSDKTREKMSEFQSSRKRNPHSEESKRKMSLAHKGKKHTEEWKRKMSKVHTGKMFSEERKENISKSKIGHTVSRETREKIARSLNGKSSGKNNPSWLGGKSFEPYSLDWTETLRLAIRQRDNFTCQKCGITEEECIDKYKRILSVNHIDFDKKNCDPKNLNTLCVSCNSSINFNRDYWKVIFQEKLEIFYENSRNNTMA